MNDLPDDTQIPAPVTQTDPQPAIGVGYQTSQPVPSSPGMHKELEGGIHISPTEAGQLTEIGKDIEIPKEVAQAGVKIAPTIIPIPPPVTAMGVKAAGQNIPAATGVKSSVPLSDDQISQGIKKSVTDSWRWLAEWCVRKIKQLHTAVKPKS